ncbi:hypothetical protein A4X13_0g6537 [Tilletia indica]|uniref:Uncharacterized protein n=1 Tax=Tilletia indica TaxID=43049 RepID=A0A177TWN3_9BASI|nr:hypothetical protein A4X13_0g6537 [Tilletia indica]
MDPSGSLASPRPPRLPAEILAYIIDLSASSEPAPSKHHLALALTSKAVHAFSERGRWRSVAIRTYSQLFTFYDYLGAQEEVLQQLCGEGRAGWKGPIGTRRWTPNPAKLVAYIVNFLIELDNPSFLQQTGSTTGDHAESHLHALQELFIGILSRLTNGSPKLRVMSLSSIALSGLSHIKQDPQRIARIRRTLSASNEDACPLIGPFGPEELTLEWDGKEETLQAFLFSSCWCPPPEPRSGRTESHVNPPPVYIGLASRLRRLHLVGYDPQSPFDGFPLPIEILTNSVIAGSLKSTYHLVHVRQAAYKTWRKSLQQNGLTGKEDLDTGPIPCVTHLRYDTVKFTLRPFEALAPRLLPFFEHLHVVGANYPPSRSAATLTSRPNQKRTRHPFHEDNSYQISLNEIYSSQTDDRARLKETAEYHLRTALGAGAFARLHLAWDLPPLEQENEQLSSQIAAMSVSAAESGWPTERRDVWTNTSSAGSRIVNRSASGSGVRPKGPSTATSPFTMELAEAIEHRLQFPFTQQVFEARRNGTYPRKALVQNRSKEDLQALRREPDLWPSDTERCADALARSLGEELVLRGYAPTRSAHRADVDEVLDLDSQVQLELIPISPYAPAPDGPAQVGPDLPRGSRGVYGAAASRPRPEPILKLGGSYAAVTPNERIRLFLDRIQGKSGSW